MVSPVAQTCRGGPGRGTPWSPLRRTPSTDRTWTGQDIEDKKTMAMEDGKDLEDKEDKEDRRIGG